MQAIFKIVLCSVIALALAACADNPYQRTMIGSGVGAATGAGIGVAVAKDNKRGALIGGAIGALAGAAVGNYMDRQQQALQQALAEEQRRNNIGIVRQPDNSIRLDLPSEVLFDFDSAAIKPNFGPALDKVSGVLNQYPNTTVTVVGYTDSQGSDTYNLNLSRQRAQSVASFLGSKGVAPQRLSIEGRGEQNPRADNSTAAGRAQNRRVEILIRPVVEGQQQPVAGQPGTSPPPAAGGYGAPGASPPPAAGGYGAPGTSPPPAAGGYGAPGSYAPPASSGYGTSGGYPPPPSSSGAY